MTGRTDPNTLTVVIAHQSDEPIYEQIERQFRHAIMTGMMQEGDNFPHSGILPRSSVSRSRYNQPGL